MKTFEEGTECSEMLVQKIRRRGNHSKERIQHSEQGQSLKQEIYFIDEHLLVCYIM